MKTAGKRLFRTRSIRLVRNPGWVTAAVLTAVILAGCASEVSNHTFLREARTPRPGSASVDIFTNGLPTRQFERVAILDVHCEAQFFADRTIQNAIPIFVKEARAAGCDAVIEIQEAKAPENWTLETKVRHYTGVGVTYK
jgi:hypothetical protein